MKKYILPVVATLLLAACQKSKPYDATGIFDATTVTVSSETSGKLLSLSPAEGDLVKEGELLGLVDTTMLVLQQMQLRSQQQAIESNSPDLATQAAALRQQIAHAQSEYDRVERLFSQGGATAKQRDDAKAQVTVLESQLKAQLSTLGKSRSAVQDNAVALEYQRAQIENQISKSKITSPLSGTILTKFAQPGEFVTPGRPLYKIANLNDIYLRAYVTTEQLAKIKLGQKVTVIADFGGKEQYDYPGTITWISQESEFTPKSIQTNDSRANLVYAINVRVANDGRLKLGQYGEVKFQ